MQVHISFISYLRYTNILFYTLMPSAFHSKAGRLPPGLTPEYVSQQSWGLPINPSLYKYVMVSNAIMLEIICRSAGVQGKTLEVCQPQEN